MLCHNGPTYIVAAGSSNIDYFVVSPELQAAMVKPSLVPISCIKGHHPVLTGWDSHGLSRMVTIWRRPRRPALFKISPQDQDDDDDAHKPEEQLHLHDDPYAADAAVPTDVAQGTWTQHRLQGYSQLLPPDGEGYVIAEAMDKAALWGDCINGKTVEWAQEVYNHLKEPTGMCEPPVGQYHYAQVTLRRALRFEEVPGAALRARYTVAQRMLSAASRIRNGLASDPVPQSLAARINKALGDEAPHRLGGISQTGR